MVSDNRGKIRIGVLNMQRYFLDNQHFHDGYVNITGDDAKHIVRVMRMKIGDKIICCEKAGSCYLSQISNIADDLVTAKIISQEDKSVELPIHVTISQGLPKGDKFELVIQKGTELGAASFIPFEAERSVVKFNEKKGEKKIERWNKIAKEAAEQSHRQILPMVTPVHRFQELLKILTDFDYVLVAYEEAAKNDEKSYFHSVLEKMKDGEKLLFIFGPEGGFSHREIELLKEHGAVICGLGPRIMRTETAPLYCLGAISYHFELMR